MKNLLLVAAFCVSGIAFAASDNPLKNCPDFPAPKTAKLQSVSSQMNFNDVPMAIRRFDGVDAPESVLAFYREIWAATKSAPGPVEYPLGPWKVIASQRGDCFFTVQVMSDGGKGATGFLGATAPPSDRPLVKAELPMMTGSNVVNDIVHNDAGKAARTVLLTNRFSPETNADFYRNAYSGKGWEVVTHHRFDKPNGRGDVLVMKDGLREVSITTLRQNEDTQVLLNFVDTP